jgi:hypothetical protein
MSARYEGDPEGDHHPLGPPLELAALPAQRVAKLRVAGEFEEEGVARPGTRCELPGFQSGHGAQPSISPSSPLIAGIAAGSKSARSRSATRSIT